MQDDQRVYHAPAERATWRRLASSCLLALMLSAPARAAVVPVVPTASAPVVPAAQVEAKLRQAILDLFATPQRLLSVVPLTLPPDELRKTLYAMDVLFRPAKIAALTLRGVTSDGKVAYLELRITDINVFGLRVDETVLIAEDFRIDVQKLQSNEVVLTGDAKAKMSARVLEADLNRVSPAYKMEIEHDDFAVSGRAGFMFIRAGYRLHGNLLVTPENSLIFRPKSLSYGILPIPRALYDRQVRKLNPLFDMARFLGTTRGAFDLKFDTVQLEKEVCSVALSGTLHAKPLKVEPLPPLPPR